MGATVLVRSVKYVRAEITSVLVSMSRTRFRYVTYDSLHVAFRLASLADPKRGRLGASVAIALRCKSQENVRSTVHTLKKTATCPSALGRHITLWMRCSVTSRLGEEQYDLPRAGGVLTNPAFIVV